MAILDRADGGRRLAPRVAEDRDLAVVLGIPHGGVIVAGGIAEVLKLPLDVWVVCDVCAAAGGEPIGAVAEGEGCCFDVRGAPVPASVERSLRARAESGRLARDVRRFRGTRARPNLAGRAVVLVDDGASSPMKLRAALAGVRNAGAGHVTLALPVVAAEDRPILEALADRLVTLDTVARGAAAGSYRHFAPISEMEVDRALFAARRGESSSPNARRA